ncbi:VrrB protein [Hyphomicrobium sp.]|uniref:VrrB protein n=1 Tax=Hyphomicrobium sp. TaxID=82 RepID=UPI002D772C36|nr:VrrB protein [Hyphomicrobium sp.]HET6389109.1 VrrB protein [Hyphomicrobium sp.]
MRKLIMSLSILAGLLFAGTLPSSANAAAGLTAAKPKVEQTEAPVTQARWRHRHRHWGPNIYFGFGAPYFYGPRYGYYDGYYGRPYYGYRYRRHWRHHHHHRGWGHRHHRHHGHHHRRHRR